MHHHQWVKAAVNPFDPGAVGAQIPTDSPAHTYSTGAKLIFDCVLGSDGSGIVMFNPSPWSDMQSVWYSNDATKTYNQFDNSVLLTQWADTAVAAAYNLLGLGSTGFASLPYTSAGALGIDVDNAYNNNAGQTYQSFTPPTVRARVVSGGVKMTFTGATLTDGGVFYLLVDPSHDNMFGQTINSYLNQFTSTKIQKLAMRRHIEINVIPVTRAQQELSNAYDDVVASRFISVGAGIGGGSCLLHTGGAQLIKGSVENSVQTGQVTGMIDIIRDLRAAMSLMYPLARRDCAIKMAKEMNAAGNALLVRQCSWDATGVVTWTSNAPANVQGLVFMAVANTVVAPDPGVGNAGPVFFYYDGTNWYIANQTGMRLSVLSSAINFNFVGATAYAPVISGVIIKAGSAMAGQTFHVECQIIAEYSGLGVQGRTKLVVPHQDSVGVVQSAVLQAREHAGSSEMASVKGCFHIAINEAAAHMPDLAQAAVNALAPEMSPIIGNGARALGALAGRGLKRSFGY